MTKFLSFVILLLLIFDAKVHANHHNHWELCHCNDLEHKAEELARCLVSTFWHDVVVQDVIAYSNLLSNQFQGLNLSGHYNKENQVTGLMQVTVNSFHLKNLVAAKYHHTLVVSYDFIASGKGIVSGPSIDIWNKIDSEWKLVSHSYVPFK